jgi:hypothetical protein
MHEIDAVMSQILDDVLVSELDWIIKKLKVAVTVIVETSQNFGLEPIATCLVLFYN